MQAPRRIAYLPFSVAIAALLALSLSAFTTTREAEAGPAKKADHHHAQRRAHKGPVVKKPKQVKPRRTDRTSTPISPSSSTAGEGQSSGGAAGISPARAVSARPEERPAKVEPATNTGAGDASQSPPPESSHQDNASSPQPPTGTGPTQPPSMDDNIQIPANARYVSASSGSDSNPGTQTSPWKTLAKAVAVAKPGDVVVLLPGTYGALGATTDISGSGTASAPIVFTSLPGSAEAVIKGYTRITGSHLLINSLTFEGPTGAVLPQTASNPGGQEVQVSIMYGSDVELRNSEILNNAWHAGVYVYAEEDIRINSNYIHDNGDATTGANLDHGVYWCAGSGEVSDNTITDNVSYGVQLYPEANGVTVAHNTITGNGRGGIIVANGSSQNQLLNNAIGENAYYGIRAYELTGSDNLARGNAIWSNPENISGSGIAYSETRLAKPAI